MEEESRDPKQQENSHHHHNPQDRVLKVLEALKEASHNVQNTDIKNSRSSSSLNALLELETETAIFSDDPSLTNLAHHLSQLKSLFHTLHQSKPTSSIRSFFRRRANAHNISRLAGSIEAEIQAWIDREIVESLVNSLNSNILDDDEEQKLNLMASFESRIARGFDRDLQDLILKLKVFAAVESTLCSPTASKAIREQSAFVVAVLVQFNKDVFVGEVMMGPTVRALVSMATSSSIRVLCTLIRSIKSPLVDDIQSNRELPKIIRFLGSAEIEFRAAALDLVLEIGYFGRKEAIEEMVEEGLVKKLMELQRSDCGGSLIEMGGSEEEEGEGEGKGVEMEAASKMTKKRNSKEARFLERHPFASCVARFAIQLEVGEGLRQREKRALKLEVLRRVREAASSDAEAATILAEVLWGSSP